MRVEQDSFRNSQRLGLVVLALASALGTLTAGGCGGEDAPPPPPAPTLVAPPQPGVVSPGLVPGQPPGQVTPPVPGQPVVPGQAPTQVAPAGADPTAALDQQLNQKIVPIIRECLNRFDQSVGRSRGRYLQWVESEERGPTGRERHVYGLYQINGNLAGCQTAIQTSNAAPPADADLQAAATAYGAALAEVVAKVNDAYPYYDRENYRDDNFERGRAMHAGLMAAFNAFRAASTELDDRVSTANRGITERRIARLANDPRRAVQVMVERHLLLAEDTLKLVHGWSVDNRRLSGIDADAMVAQVAQLETLTDQLAAAIAAGQGADAVGSTSSHWLESYSREAVELLTHAKGLMRRVRDRETFSRGELMNLSGSGGWMVSGAPPRMIREFNEMIDQYNRIRWLQ